MTDYPPGGMLIRPMRPSDVEDAERLSAEAFLEADRRSLPRSTPAPTIRSEERAGLWRERTHHFLRTDPDGCWVADRDGEMVGFATSLRRDTCWILATYAVRPTAQGQGLGRPLLEAALTHSRSCLRGMIAAGDDPRAFRRYRAAGFHLHPQLLLHGRVDRSAIPSVRHVREGVPGDFDLMDSLDRRCREAAHGVDHPVLAKQYRLLVVDHSTGQGYAYADESGSPAIVAATNRRTATRLLWAALATSPPGLEVTVAHVTAANEWASDVGLAARLSVITSGHLAVRGMKPPVPYLHHGAFL